MMDLFLTKTQLSILQDVNLWTGVVWITCDVFLSCLDSHLMVPIHCRGYIAEQVI